MTTKKKYDLIFWHIIYLASTAINVQPFHQCLATGSTGEATWASPIEVNPEASETLCSQGWEMQ